MASRLVSANGMRDGTHCSSVVIDSLWLHPHTFIGVTSIIRYRTRPLPSSFSALFSTWHWQPSTSTFIRSTYLHAHVAPPGVRDTRWRQATATVATTRNVTPCGSGAGHRYALIGFHHSVDGCRVHRLVLSLNPCPPTNRQLVHWSQSADACTPRASS